MGKVKKVILVTEQGHPLHNHFNKIASRLSKELNVELELRYSDYVFVTQYGDTDDLGLTWLPQMFVELDDGSIVKVLTQPNLTDMGYLDEEKDYKAALEALKPYIQ